MESSAAPARGAWRPPLALLWIVPAVGFMLGANGRWIVPIAAWLAPMFLLRFVRSQSALVGSLVGLAAVLAISFFTWQGLVPLSGAPYYIVTALIGATSFVPYVVDRLWAHRLRGPASTLLFPCAAVAIEFLTATVSPYGTWGSPAYTQAEYLPLMQVVSVTGIWGVSFLIAWFASAANSAWDHRSNWRAARTGVAAFAVVLTLVDLAGAIRLLKPPAGETLRIASFTITPNPPLPDLLRRSYQGAALDTVRARLEQHQDSLFARARLEARAGAQFVFWSETNLVCLKEEEALLIERGAQFAIDEKVYLGMAVAATVPGQGVYENELLILDPDGGIVSRYHKARPVPGDPETGADLHLAVRQTGFGRLAGAICFDGDFPGLIRDAGRGHADLMIVPSSDWREIDPIHTRMALVRGIENGCSVVRQTNKGLSAAADPQGRILASVDFFRTRPAVMVAQVPVRGVSTLYARVGDLFAWLCVVALAMLLTWALRSRTAHDGRSAGPGARRENVGSRRHESARDVQ
jgi:apolipoprotein N-acyltransferase